MVRRSVQYHWLHLMCWYRPARRQLSRLSKVGKTSVDEYGLWQQDTYADTALFILADEAA
jgi:hypothetical protein